MVGRLEGALHAAHAAAVDTACVLYLLALSLRLLAMLVFWPRHRRSAFHVLAIGSIAGLIMGMITRIALDHTGRMQKADASESDVPADAGRRCRAVASSSGPAGRCDAALIASPRC